MTKDEAAALMFELVMVAECSHVSVSAAVEEWQWSVKAYPTNTPMRAFSSEHTKAMSAVKDFAIDNEGNAVWL